MRRTLFTIFAVVHITVVGQTCFAVDVTAPDAKVELIHGDYGFTEGATSDKDGNVYFVDQNNNAILKWDVTEKKMSTFMQPSNYSNGMTFDNKGNLIACADEKNEMWSIDVKTKEHKVLLKDLDGKLFNGPNDVWCHPRTGRIYFTDPYYHRDWWKPYRADKGRDASEIPPSVYYFEPDTGKVVRLIENVKQADGTTLPQPDAKHFRMPNGIIGTPDGKTLYVSDIMSRKTYSYEIKADGSLGEGKDFCAVGSDGMTIDSEGNVYLSSRTVQVFDKTGQKVQDIQVPEGPANMCFGSKEMDTLFITARKGFYAVKMRVKGVGPQ